MPQLLVTLLRANSLPVADTYVQGNASDPFVTFQVGDEYMRSSCITKALDPVWQPAETFVFELPHPSQATERHLLVQVSDNDRWKLDDLLGELSIPLSSFERRPNEAVIGTYELIVPETLKAAMKTIETKASIQLDICYLQETDGQQTLCVWENEDYVDGHWTPSHNKERRHWSSFDLQTSSDNFEQVVPDVPEGLEASGWAYSNKRGDDHGWIYASTYTGPWSSMPSALCYARRRLWQNHCRPAVACE